jgi:hypothetical protein
MTSFAVSARAIEALDIAEIGSQLEEIATAAEVPESTFSFTIDFPRAPEDPRELSEIPEIRQWFLRLDSRYPWLPLYLDIASGELGRYVAMLVPHQFKRQQGIVFVPEALEIWMMHRVFTLCDWFQRRGTDGTPAIKAMALVLGYDLDDRLFSLLK